MGSSRYDDAAYDKVSSLRSSYASTKGISIDDATFSYSHDIKTGKIAAEVHDKLKPFGVKIRESRDSGDNIKVPVIVTLDTTGSMAVVPSIVQSKLPKLFGGFLADKASGRKYLGEDGYPDIMVSAVDDYFAQRNSGHKDGEGALQVGQFESGIELDDNITNIWLTGNGGGNLGESYDLALYFVARHTAHDHYDKRKRKGYMFILGDEPVFDKVSKEAVRAVIGDALQSDIPTAQVLKEVQKRYHVIFGYPTGHENGCLTGWRKLFGEQNVIEFDPQQVCEFIVGAVATIESGVSVDELEEDSIAVGALSKALAPLSKGAVDRTALPDLPAVAGKGGAKRL